TVDDPDMIADWLRPGGVRTPDPSTPTGSPSPFHGEETGGAAVSSLSRSDGEGDREAVEGSPASSSVTIVRGDPGAPPVVDVLISEGHVPWAGHTGQHAIPEVYGVLRRAGMSLI